LLAKYGALLKSRSGAVRVVGLNAMGLLTILILFCATLGAVGDAGVERVGVAGSGIPRYFGANGNSRS
jgi:hypothetical protein